MAAGGEGPALDVLLFSLLVLQAMVTGGTVKVTLGGEDSRVGDRADERREDEEDREFWEEEH
jgi:hypothetical protein